MKTMYDLSRELGKGLFDLNRDYGFDVLCREMADRMARMKDEILVAWFAEHGFAPGKAVLVHDCTGGMVRYYIREFTAEEADRAITPTNNGYPATRLKDIESFIEGRMKCAIPMQMLGAYRDVLFLVRQHINATKGPCDHSPIHHHETAITKCDICFKEWI